MIRFVFRSCAIFFLALMVVYAIVDLTRSIGASAVVLTPLSAMWDAIAPQSRTDFASWLSEAVHPFFADPMLATLVTWPAVLVFAGLAIVFALLGRKRRKRSRLFD